MFLVKRMKKSLSIMIVLAMSLTLLSTAGAANASNDLEGHWAEAAMRQWAGEGLLKGYKDGSYKPEGKVTRAELAAFINRAFQLTATAEVSFPDLSESNWAYRDIAVAVKAGYMKGYNDGSFRPDKHVSREEAASMVAALLELELDEAVAEDAFTDASSIAAWSNAAVAALVKAELITGLQDGSFAPQASLTRAQAVTLLDKALGYERSAIEYDTTGVYGPENGTETIKGDVIVSAAGVTLRNLVIEGDLTITEAVGEGDVFFKSIKVNGTTNIQGGGENSVHFEDSVLVRISVDKRDGTVRVVVVGETSVQHVVVNSPVKLEESHVTDSGFGNVELSSNLPSGSEVQLVGVFENVSVLASDIKVKVPSGSISQLNVEAGAEKTKIELSKEAKVLQLVLDAVAELLGQGTIEKATVNKAAEGSSFETKPSDVAGDGAAAPAPAVPVTPPSGGGGNSGGGNGGNNGGNNGEEPGQGNACTGTAEECRDALLTNLEVEGFTLNQLDANDYNAGETGFESNMFGYSIITDRNMSSVTVPVTVSGSVYAAVSYSINRGNDNSYYGGTLTDTSNQFDVQIDPLEDTLIVINVRSGDNLSYKQYVITIQYPRTVQEAFKVERYPGFYDNGNVLEYRYNLIPGTLKGELIQRNDKVQLFNSNTDPSPFVTCDFSCSIPEAEVAKVTGEWYIKVFRNDNLLDEGPYQFDFTPVDRVTEEIGITVNALTKQQLIEEFVKHSSSTPYSHAFNLQLDPQKLNAALPEVKYINYHIEQINNPWSLYPDPLVSDMLKIGTKPRGYSNSLMDRVDPIRNTTEKHSFGGIYFHQSDSDSDKKVNDYFVFIGLYDENLAPVGYYVIPLVFDQDHVADGYTAAGTWEG